MELAPTQRTSRNLSLVLAFIANSQPFLNSFLNLFKELNHHNLFENLLELLFPLALNTF